MKKRILFTTVIMLLLSPVMTCRAEPALSESVNAVRQARPGQGLTETEGEAAFMAVNSPETNRRWPEATAEGETVSGQAEPGQILSSQTRPNQLLMGQAEPDQILSSQAVPDQVLTGQAEPNQVLSSQTVPDQVLPDQTPAGAEIKGEDGLQIAVQGESLAVFSVGEGYRFLPIEEKGIHFDAETGRLITTPEAGEQTITILAEPVNGGRCLSRDVTLYKSWRLGPDVADIARFPSPESVKGPEADWVRFFRGGGLAAMRAAALIALIIPAVAYVFFRRRTANVYTKNSARRLWQISRKPGVHKEKGGSV